LSEDEIRIIVDATISEVGATSIKDMGQVMGNIKSKVQGQADMGVVGGLVKSRLS